MKKPGKKDACGGQDRPERGLTDVNLGLQRAVTCLLFFGAGHLLDRHFGSTPWCLLGGGVLGLVVGFYHFLKESL